MVHRRRSLLTATKVPPKPVRQPTNLGLHKLVNCSASSSLGQHLPNLCFPSLLLRRFPCCACTAILQISSKRDHFRTSLRLRQTSNSANNGESIRFLEE